MRSHDPEARCAKKDHLSPGKSLQLCVSLLMNSDKNRAVGSPSQLSLQMRAEFRNQAFASTLDLLQSVPCLEILLLSIINHSNPHFQQIFHVLHIFICGLFQMKKTGMLHPFLVSHCPRVVLKTVTQSVDLLRVFNMATGESIDALVAVVESQSLPLNLCVPSLDGRISVRKRVGLSFDLFLLALDSFVPRLDRLKVAVDGRYLRLELARLLLSGFCGLFQEPDGWVDKDLLDEPLMGSLMDHGCGRLFGLSITIAEHRCYHQERLQLRLFDSVRWRDYSSTS
ncbi:hypothetical protein BDV96DRAFT_112632 [Lophiotrema nucula]|uniref:Uncharacterized protein n=1 Tax=Lophiotrema nucula TaxID=690887 RepID=A0A6A5Z566_9PLEO|nr:hypothetical protein BDV96DRAFT_112632 [Lophiotrema nucula]